MARETPVTTLRTEELLAQRTWLHALAARLAAGPTAALALIKQALDEAEVNELDDQLDLERELQEEAAESPDHAEGLRAFLEKRPPVFTGRKD